MFRTTPRSWVAGAAALASLVLSAPAGAAPTTVVDPDGSGATVTLDRSEAAPGERIRITGTSFPVTVNVRSSGNPIVAVRPYAYDAGPVWGAGGPDYYSPRAPELVTNEARHWFETSPASPETPDTVGFTGYLEVPRDATPQGPIASLPGQHWFQILSGAPFTSTDGSSAGRRTGPITYRVPFTVVENLTLGVRASGAFHVGTTFRPGAAVAVRGRGFTPDAPVAVALDGTAVPASISTDAEGAFPSTAQVALPAATQPGSHTLRFSTGDVAHERTITVTPPPSATLRTPAIRPGGTIAYEVADFVGVQRRGQKVAVVVPVRPAGASASSEKVLACLQTDDRGRASGAVAVPADVVPDAPVRFNAGASCVLPAAGPPVVNDAPGASVQQALTVSATAPALSTAPSGTAGSALGVAGEGFGASAPVTATFRGGEVRVASASDAQGRVDGSFALPEEPGEGVLLVTAGSRTAAALVAVQARPASPPAAEPGPAPTPVPGTPGPSPSPAPSPAPAPAASTPSTPRPLAPKVRTAGLLRTRLTLRLRSAVAKGTVVTVRSRSRIRLTPKGRSRIVTLATARVGAGSTLRLALTADGRRAVRRYRRITLVVRVAPPGATASSSTLVLKR